MSGAGEPHDWFGGARPETADRAPTPVAEAFGHLRRTDEDAAGESDWFAASAAEQPPAASVPAGLAEVSAASAPERMPAAPAASALGDFAAAEPAAEPKPEPAAPPAPAPAPETDPRVRLRALTGGLADLSDAMAAIGIESVALRSGPERPAAPAPAPAADFRVRCPDCGPQYVAVADVRFVETGDGADANRYLFTCPACGARVRRPAGPELAEILKSAGVATLALRRGPGQAL
ncbi:putative RNA-binding Zn-ribbon protein involved in translation (DUF1610 family) [Catenulispora sp. EB89]|uniref:hypothetical protein n=1 Tax=Catenulispora sp. EB89 TaxID=3156257 RepID=UPI0035149716